MAWVVIVIAGLFEVAMAYSLKLSNGFSVPLPSFAFLIFAFLSFALLAMGLRSPGDRYGLRRLDRHRRRRHRHTRNALPG